MHPQQKSLEHAGLLLKRFIEDIRRDRMFAHRIFYPVLYRNEISKPIVNKDNKVVASTIETEIEFYLLKAEEYATNGAVLVAMFLANGPMVPQSHRIKLQDFCNHSNHKTIVARTKAFLDILKDDNMFNFVFYSLTAAPSQDTDVEMMRERFEEVVQILKRREQSKLPPGQNVRVSRDIAKNREYLLKHFQYISEKDIVHTLNFISYMCTSSSIVSDFTYRPVSNETITDLLNYGSEEAQKDLLLSKLENMLSDKNYDTIASDQITYLIEIMYKDYASIIDKNNSFNINHFILGGVPRNTLDSRTHEIVKMRLSKSAQKIHEYTKRYLSSVLTKALSAHSEFKNSGKYIDTLIDMLIRYAIEGDEEIKKNIYRYISNPHAFLNECKNNCQSVNDASLCCLIYSIIKNDVDYFRNYALTTNVNEASSKLPTTEKIEKFATTIDNFAKAVEDLINNGPRMSLLSDYIERVIDNIHQRNKNISRELISEVFEELTTYAFDSNDIIADSNKILNSIDKEYENYESNTKPSLLSKIIKGISNKLGKMFSKAAFKSDLMSVAVDALKTSDYYKNLDNDERSKVIAAFNQIIEDLVNLRQFLMLLYVQKVLLYDKMKDLLLQYNAIENNASSRVVGIDYAQVLEEKIRLANMMLFYKHYVLEINDKINDVINNASESKYFKNIRNEIVSLLKNTLQYTSIIEALRELNFDTKGAIKIPAIIDKIGEDAIVRAILQHYFQSYLQPILHELVSAAFEEDIISKIQVNDHLLTKDVLNLSHYLTPSVVGTLTFDANVFNDLAYYTYVFMGDTFAGLTRSNVDSVMKFLDDIYGIRYYNVVILGAEDVFLYLNYVGIPALYRGAKTKLRRPDLEYNYRWMTSAIEGLYKNIQLPRKRH